MYYSLKNREFVTTQNSIEANEIKVEEIKQFAETEEVNINEDIWQIEIPKINLIAPIAEGTSEAVMLEYVGHFENTEFWSGNVGLAAHNRRLSSKLFWKT